MRRGYVATALGQVHYVRSGQGLPLLLLPAAGRSARMFAGLLPELDGVDAIAVDTPGFGRSDDLPAGTTIEALADSCIAVLDELGASKAAVYGLHTGNKIATAAAVRHPDRITRLILAGQSHSLIPDQDTRNAGIRDIIASYVDFGTGSSAAADSALRIAALLEAGRDGVHPVLGGNILDHVLDEIEARGTSGLYLANFGYDLGQGFRDIPVPTRILEIATPRETRDIGLQGPAVVDLIPDASLVTLRLPDGEALTLEDRPSRLAAIILSFLAT